MNDSKNSSAARDMFRGAVIGAAVATAVALLMNKDTRQKVTKGVKDAYSEIQKRAKEMGAETKEKYEKTAQRIEEKLPKKEGPESPS